MKVVLDTNFLVSALLSPGGMSARLVRGWLDERFTLVSHPLQLDELRDATRRDKIRAHIRPARAGRLVNQIARLAELPETLPRVSAHPIRATISCWHCARRARRTGWRRATRRTCSRWSGTAGRGL